jgi:hypothetical protein
MLTSIADAFMATDPEMLRRRIGKDVEVVCHLGPELGPVEVGRNGIGLVIMNLALNARDAMPLPVEEVWQSNHSRDEGFRIAIARRSGEW